MLKYTLLLGKGKSKEKPTSCNCNNLLISKISSACSGQSFAHLQEHKTEIYSMWYSVLQRWIYK